MHAQELGFRTILIDDCSRGIQMDAIKNTMKKIEENHGLVVKASEVERSSEDLKRKMRHSFSFSFEKVKAMVQGRDRRLELGYQWALQCRKGIRYPAKNKNSRHQLEAGATSAMNPSTDGSNPISNHNAVKASA